MNITLRCLLDLLDTDGTQLDYKQTNKQTHKKRLNVLSTEHVGRPLHFCQLPLAEQTQKRCVCGFTAAGAHFVLDKELFTCNGEGKRRRPEIKRLLRNGARCDSSSRWYVPSRGNLSLSWSLLNVSHRGTAQRQKDEKYPPPQNKHINMHKNEITSTNE